MTLTRNLDLFLQGVENGQVERVCQSDRGKGITSGGGFSNFYQRQPWQDAAVASYFTAAAAENKVPLPGYSTSGRGIPDISLAGAYYFTWMIRDDNPNGFLAGMSGTSAACPVGAAFISNINAARLALGKSSVGWFNPTLNMYAPSFVNDVTIGNNNCVMGSLPCSTGYTATKGWDPASGWGSINYAKMHLKLVALGNPGTSHSTLCLNISHTA